MYICYYSSDTIMQTTYVSLPKDQSDAQIRTNFSTKKTTPGREACECSRKSTGLELRI